MADGLFIASCTGSAYALRPAGRSVEHYLSEMAPFFEKLKAVDSLDVIEEPVLNYSVCDFRGSEDRNLDAYPKKKQRIRRSTRMWKGKNA